jgi:hypothetical protein
MIRTFYAFQLLKFKYNRDNVLDSQYSSHYLLAVGQRRLYIEDN